MSRDWAEKTEGLVTVNITSYSGASTFVLSLRLFWVVGEVLGWGGKVVGGSPWEPGRPGSQVGWEERDRTGDTGLLEPTLSLVLPGR